MRKCLLAMLILMLVILMLIMMLINLNTGYADTDADLCIRIMSLCCKNHNIRETAKFVKRSCIDCTFIIVPGRKGVGTLKKMM